MKKSILIISYVPNYNRQGYDLAECLRSRGYSVWLFQMDGVSDHEKGVVGVKCIKPHGYLHLIHMLRNFLVFFLKTVFAKKDIVVCIGKPMLPLGGIYHLLVGSKLIWYSLEYSKLGQVDRYVYRKCVNGYIDVEENRMNAIFSEYGQKKKSIICHNMAHLHEKPIKGGRLRGYLRANYPELAGKKLIIYAGSYQGYACLDKIVEVGSRFDNNCCLIIMAYGLPRGLLDGAKNCLQIPPVGGEEFYQWLSDADCALLPYESDSNFNVLNCSPQKIFDCYVVGVPYVASDRPIVRKILDLEAQCGLLCDFTNIDDIYSKISSVLSFKVKVSERMRQLHRSLLNYGRLTNKLDSLIKSVLSP